MKWLKNNLANFFTLGNLSCGFLGIVLVLGNSGQPLKYGFWLMIIAVILDFFDGFIARATKTSSKIGADLDSLADMVTFGVLPGAMIFVSLAPPLNWIGILIPLLSAWRLAKFNNDERTSNYFYGLPTPANALFIGGMFGSELLFGFQYAHLTSYSYVAAFVIILMSALMVSDIKLLSNKISDFSIAKYIWHLIVLALAIVLISIFGYLGVTFAIISYALISIIVTFATAKNTKKVS